MRTYTMLVKVEEADLDELQHVNNIKYVEWIQKVSKDHWLQVAKQNALHDFIWVVREHRITYYSGAKRDDELRIQTGIIHSKGSISTRKVSMRNNKTDQLVVSSETDWCLLNAKTMKPTRIPASIENLFAVP